MPADNINLKNVRSVINPIYYPKLKDYRRFQIYKGGAGAGKSVSIAQKVVYNMIVQPMYNVMVLRNSGKDNHSSTFNEVKKCIMAWGFSDLFKVVNSWGMESITCKTYGNQCIFRGLDDVEKVKSVTFETGDLVCVWIEEASEIKEADFNQINLRLRGRGKVPKHVILSFNPIDVDSWLKPRFFDNAMREDEGYILETTYKDNAFLDDIYKAELEGYRERDEYFYQVYVLNQWGSRNTRGVFQNVKIHDFDIKQTHYKNIRYGMDFGYNHANAMVGTGWIDGELYIFTEWYAKKTLNSEFMQMVETSGLEHDWTITADSAEPDKIAEWLNEGWNVYGAIKGPGSLKRGIEYLKALPTIHIHKSCCPNAAREFMRFKYKELKDGRILDEVVQIDDDTIAATRYAVEEFVTNAEQSHFFIKR